MVKRIVAVGVLLVMLFSLMSCGEDEDMKKSIPFKEGVFEGRFIGLSGGETFKEIIRSQEELISFFDEHEVSWIAAPIWERYDAKYFESQALIFYFFWITDNSIERYVEDVCVQENSLTIKIIRKGTHENQVEGFKRLIVEVEKSDVITVEKIESIVRYVNN